jgi:hypothetical protein
MLVGVGAKGRRVGASLRSQVAWSTADPFLTAQVCPSDEGDDMTSPTHVDKAEIVATLRSRGLHARADWVDRALPELVDTHLNAATASDPRH